MVDPYTLDVLALLVLAFGTVGLGLWMLYVDRVLRDPDHPEHELAKEALADQQRDADRDHLRLP